MTIEKQWFTRKEAVSYLCIGETTLAQFEKTGDAPPYYTLGPRKRMYEKDALDAWMKRHYSAVNE